jgi:hypothetical protein
MMPVLVLALAIPPLVGFACAWGLRTKGVPTPRMLVLVASVGVGVGLGLSACASFLGLWVFGCLPVALVVGDVALLSLGIARLWILTRRAGDTGRAPEIPRDPAPPLRRLIEAALLLGVACAVSSFLVLSYRSPHGQWDAWSIWNLRARFLVQAGSEWRDAFSPLLAWSHPNYPLSLPLSVARLWQYLGGESPAAASAIALLFTFSTVALTWAALAILRGRSQGALGALLLLGTSALIISGAAQEADIPLGFFLLATLVGFALEGRQPDHGESILVVTGLTAGLAAWTKNEGWLVALSVVVARATVLGRRAGGRAWRRELIPFALGIGPVLAVVLLFKIALVPLNDLVAGQGWRETARYLLTPGRYAEVARGFKRALVEADPSLVAPVLALLLYLACVGLDPDRRDEAGFATGLVTLGLLLVGYGLVYLVTPYDLAWHMSTSAGRLLLQLWPSAVFLACLAARPFGRVRSHPQAPC